MKWLEKFFDAIDRIFFNWFYCERCKNERYHHPIGIKGYSCNVCGHYSESKTKKK